MTEKIKYKAQRIAIYFALASILTLAGCNHTTKDEIKKVDYEAMLDTILHHYHPDTIIVLELPDSLK